MEVNAPMVERPEPVKLQAENGQKLSQFVNSLDGPPTAPDTAAQGKLPGLDIVDGSKSGTATGSADAPPPAKVPPAADGTPTVAPLDPVSAKMANDERLAGQEIANAAKAAASGVSAYAHEILTQPSQALVDAGHALSGAARSAADQFEQPAQFLVDMQTIGKAIANSSITAAISDNITFGNQEKLRTTPAVRNLINLNDYSGI
jgi:hypothetical protein